MGFDVQGHRGARGLLPENTLAGFEYAIAVGVTTLELDTGISKDGVVMVSHDPMINPNLCLDLQGRRLPPDACHWLKDLTVEEIQSFDCGCLNPDSERFSSWRAVPGSHIPTLQQVIDLAERRHSGIRYNIESKVNPLQPDKTASPRVFAEKLVELIRYNGLLARATVQSFDWEVLRWCKQLEPTIQTSALVFHSEGASTIVGFPDYSPYLAGFDLSQFAGDMVKLVQATGFVDVYSPNFETLLPESASFLRSVPAFQSVGFPVIPWTVNQAAMMHRLIHLGVDGLITDFPNQLIELLRTIRY